MKTPLLLTVVLLALVTGCSDRTSKSTTQTTASTNSGNLATAPVDYLQSITKAEQSAVKTVDVAAINALIRQFQVEQGRLPNDLDELVQSKYLSRIPPVPFGSKLVYDSTTGEAKVVQTP